MGISALITNKVLQGWVPQTDKSQALEFPSSAWSDKIVLPLDAEITESFQKTNEVTSSPVETGAEVSEHVVRKPDRLTIEAVISDTPVSLLGIKTFPARGANPVRDAYTFLDNLVETRTPFDFVGIFQVYKSYVMTSWAPVKNAKAGSILHFTATMQRVIIVSTLLVNNANLKASKKLTGGQKTSLGTQNPSPANANQNQFLHSFQDSFQGVEPTAQVL